MKLKRRARREHPETIVALIDVVFFLLVFFMIVGRMDATAPFQLLPPMAQTGSPMPGGGMTLSVSVAGELALDGVAMDRAALLTAVEARLTQSPDLLVRINADRSAPLRHFLPIVAEIEDLGAKDVVLVVTSGGA